MERLGKIVEAKSGNRPLTCTAVELRARLGHDLAPMLASGYDPSIIAEHEAFNARLEIFITHPDFGRYLGALTPLEVFGASGVRVLPLEAIRQEIQELSPGAVVFPHGYMPFATSVGGHAICFHASTGRVVWVDQGTFNCDDEISYQDRRTGEYHYVPFTPENIGLAAVPLANEFSAFLGDLLLDKLEKRLEELDLS